MNSPIVSVVIPTYDRSEFLQRAVDSVLSQSIRDIEVVVVDDGSPDPVKERYEFDQERVRVITLKQNSGVCVARNTGIQATRGEYVAFLDDDDFWSEEKLEKQLETIQGNSNVGLCYTWTRTINMGEDVIDKATPLAAGDVFNSIILNNKVSISSVVVHSDVIKQVGMFNTDLPCWEDWEWLIRAASEVEFDVVQKPLTIHQRGNLHAQRSKNIEPKVEGHERFLEAVRPLVRESDDILESEVVANVNLTLGQYALTNGHSDLARKYFFQCICILPYNIKPYMYFIIAMLGNKFYSQLRKLKRGVTNE